MKWRMHIFILAVENFYQQQFNGMFELLDDPIIFFGAQKMLELCQHVFILSWVKFHFLSIFKVLDLEKQLLEFVSALHCINVNCKKGLASLVALSEFAHGSIMDWVSLEVVLLSQNLSVSVFNIFSVLFEQVVNSDVEVFVSLH